MIPMYGATLPPAATLPLGGSPLVIIDAFGGGVLLAAVLAISAAILVARVRARCVEEHLRLPVLGGRAPLASSDAA